MQRVVLSYRRDPDLAEDGSSCYTGVLEEDKGEGVVERSELLRVQYRELLRRVHMALRRLPDAPLVFLRTERAIPAIVPVPDSLRILIRDDPLTAIRTLEEPYVQGTVTKAPPPPTLLSGEVALVGSFGELVHLQVKKGLVENPFTGTNYHPFYKDGLHVILWEQGTTRIECPIGLYGRELSEAAWAAVAVADLLKVPVPRYYLPRLWNAPNRWISRTDLGLRLEKFEKDKEKVQ